ncbi:MAG: hypothetical protein ACMVY4_17620 [Minwuia sp.]|uniref:hypothetical protein n=1 Tax=Minwuia sp. TaxID=2493630 RepID=UPI003A88FF36
MDFSAAAKPGPARATKDRIWLAAATNGKTLPPLYCRTRADLLDILTGMIQPVRGNALICWDFPFGYPCGSGIGGGRIAARLLAGMVEDGPRDRNNRFDVAADINRRIGNPPGPFWGGPRSIVSTNLTEKKPSFEHHGFAEWRVVENQIRAAGFPSINSVWQLFYNGSVGGQAIMGLALIERLNERLRGRRTRYWPFETGWDSELDGVVHAECWPSLTPFGHIDHPIRDAQQVTASRDALMEANAGGNWGAWLGRPPGLSPAELQAVEAEEGWIMGFPLR